MKQFAHINDQSLLFNRRTLPDKVFQFLFTIIEKTISSEVIWEICEFNSNLCYSTSNKRGDIVELVPSKMSVDVNFVINGSRHRFSTNAKSSKCYYLAKLLCDIVENILYDIPDLQFFYD